MSIDIDRFKSNLQTILPEGPDYTFLDFKDSPLFGIIEYMSNIVAFAELNGNAEQIKQTSSDFFRKQYALNQRKWSDYDLSLVYCVTSNNVNDSLLNEIQLDPYFCKKYVIDYTEEKKLNEQFDHLPFIPLISESVNNLIRPVSAKELLRNYAVETELINALVSPRKMSPERIISNCLAKEGIPKWTKTKTQHPKQSELSSESKSNPVHTKIKHLTVDNFRAYKHHDFDLDANVIVLFGNNGLGKTSFFEAFDFACTGSVLRLDDKFEVSSNLNRFNDSLKYLNSTDINDTSVKINLTHNSTDKELLRKLKDRTIAVTSENNINRKDSLQYITSPNEELLSMSVDNLVDLFRASHIFGQDLSKLTDDIFLQDSILDVNIISRMLSFQDYTEGIKKGSEVLDQLLKEFRNENKEIEKLNISLVEKDKQIKIYEKKFDTKISSDQLKKEIQEILNLLKEKVNIRFPKEITTDSIKNVRADLQSQLKMANNKKNNLKPINNKFDEYSKENNKVDNLNKEIKDYKAQEKLESDKKIDAEKKILESETILNDISHSIKENNIFLEYIQWLLGNYKNYRYNVEKISEEENEIKSLSEQLNNFIKQQKEIKNEIGKKNLSQEKNKKDLERLDNALLQLEELKLKLPEFNATKEKISKNNDLLKPLQVRLEAIKKEITSSNSKLNAGLRKLNTINEQIEILQQDQTEFKNLLENIEKYILSSECPVCGHEYTSKKELLDRLQSRIGTKNLTLEELQKNKIEITKNNRILSNNQKQYESDIREVNSQLQLIDDDMSALKLKNQKLEKLAISLDIKFGNTDSSKLINQAIESKKEEKRANRIEAKNISTLISTLERTDREITLKIKESENSIEEKNSLIQRYKKENKELESYTRDYKVTFQTEFEKIKLTEKETKQSDIILIKKRESHEKIISELKTKLKITCEKLLDINTSLKKLQKDLSASEKIINEYEVLLGNLKLKKGISKIDIEKLIDSTDLEIENLNDSIKEINRLELTLEASQSSAIVTKYKNEVQEEAKIKKSLEEKISKIEKWIKYFTDLVDELKSTRNESIGGYINNLGPLSSKIQKRLRSVYNFGEIKLESKDGKVFVKTQHSGNELLPTDYFSESQIQILILSLFFSTALTQNWSSFTPILLDDPVTHFDDMNCYAFTDLIRSIINTSNNKYQFIISTCEERLYALMKQKFQKMKGKAIFYEFKTIGENGPEIEKMYFGGEN